MGAEAVVVLLLSVIAAACGFARELATAMVFANGPDADALALALLYVEGVWAVMTYGVASQVLVPLFVRLDAQHDQAGRHVLSGLFVWTLAIGAPMVALALWRPDWVSRAIAPEFSPAQVAALRPLVMAAAPTCVILAIAGVASGALRARNAFYAPVVGRALFSLLTAAAIVSLGWRYGTSAAAMGLVAGALAQALLPLVRLPAAGWRLERPQLRHPQIAAAFRTTWPVLAALTSTHIVLLGAQRQIASDLPVGAFAITNYAQRLMSLASLLTMAVYTVAATDLARHFHASGLAALGARAVSHLKALSFVLAPATVGLMVLSRPLVDLTFHRGNFPASAVDPAAAALWVFATSLLPGAVAALLHLLFAAAGRPGLVLVTSLTMLVVTLGCTALFKGAVGALILPGAFSFGMLTMCAACLWASAQLVGSAVVADFGRYLSALAARMAVSVAAGALVVWLWQGPDGPARWIVGHADAAPAAAGGLIFLVVLLALSRWSRDSGMARLTDTVLATWQRLRRSRASGGTAP